MGTMVYQSILLVAELSEQAEVLVMGILIYIQLEALEVGMYKYFPRREARHS